MDVRPSGIFSVTNITMAKARKINVIVAGLIFSILLNKGFCSFQKIDNPAGISLF
jgi:hypothetical protein